MRYNWQQKDWPEFTYELGGIEELFFDFAEKAGRIGGFLEGLSKAERTEIMINTMVAEAIKTSAIEGEYLSRNDVLSSIRNNLGLAKEIVQVNDERAQGIAALMIDVRNSYSESLTQEKLFSWHNMLMKGSRGIKTGAWRSHTEPMQVISGAMGRETIHFEAPPSADVPGEMARFITWFNETAPGGHHEIKKPIVRAAITHLYFESIHPFEDGNGRIGRALSEKALSQSLGRPVLLSLSKAIEARKKSYYNALEHAQRSNEITPWITWFIAVVTEAQTDAEQHIEFTLKKARFFDYFSGRFNERQLKVVRRMLAEGSEGFEGGMNARKYKSLTGVSKATATRDLQDLVDKGIFIPLGGGRSTRYEINTNFN